MTPLLSILRDHLHSTETPPFTADWGELLALAMQHEVTAIVYAQCKNFIPQPYHDNLNETYSAVLFYYANRKKVVESIEVSLADIQHFMIKGASVAQFYPFPPYRTMGDTDIVVHTEDREEADRRLRELGLKNTSRHKDREWQYDYDSMEFELHDHLVYSEDVNVEIQEEFFNHVWNYVQGSDLDWNYHFMFLIFHLRKHFMNSGVGFRQFLDIAILVSRGPKFNWSWIRGELEKLGLWQFTERVFALNEYWFAVPSPIQIACFPESFLASATEMICKNGLFGFNNEENKGNAAVNAVRKEGYTRLAMLKRAAQGVFPGYERLQAVPRYSYLRGKRYLLPAAWIHRGVRSIANKRVGKNLKTVVDRSFADQETIERREAIYQQWGL